MSRQRFTAHIFKIVSEIHSRDRISHLDNQVVPSSVGAGNPVAVDQGHVQPMGMPESHHGLVQVRQSGCNGASRPAAADDGDLNLLLQQSTGNLMFNLRGDCRFDSCGHRPSRIPRASAATSPGTSAETLFVPPGIATSPGSRRETGRVCERRKHV